MYMHLKVRVSLLENGIGYYAITESLEDISV